MTRRNHTLEHKPPDGIPWGTLAALAAATLIAACVVGWTTQAGAATRPYAGLTADQAPDVTHIEFPGNGTARVAGTVPAGASGWLVGTFHIPDPGQWQDGQTPVATLGVPVGPFDITLPCNPGAAQVDLWLEGQTEPYAAAITLNCGATNNDTLGLANPSSATAAAVVEAPAAQPALAPGVSGSGGRVDVELPPAPSPPPAAVSTAVLAASTLPNTGATEGLLLVAGCVLVIVGSGIFFPTRRAGRQ